MHKNAIDLTGTRFGRLVAVETVGSQHGQRVWRCVCDCGNTKEVLAGNLRRGKSTSCGCYAREVTHNNKNRTHGQSGTQTHKLWKGMRNRCNNTADPAYIHYGGRGIRVCERWNDYENFLADMGAKPHGLSIERIDNNKGYEPGNCRWATTKEQSLNRRNSRLITFRGVTKNLCEWAEHLGIGDATIRQRLFSGWDVEKTLMTPVRRKR